MNTHVLYRQTLESVRLEDALKGFAAELPEATALLYSPAWCRLVRWQEGALHGPGQASIDCRAVFEARIFAEAGELRWLHESGGRGRASYVAEARPSVTMGTLHEQPCIDRLEQGYLLWGSAQSVDANAGWARMALARVGAFDVPVREAQPGKRVRLKTIEHLARAEHGNTIVCDERLVGLEVV